MKQKFTLGLIVGNRVGFPGYVCESGRAVMLKVLEEEHVGVVALGLQDTAHGSVESLNDARRCADLFKAHRDDIDGILVSLPNFGDERAIANTIRLADLGVPVLVHAFPDARGKMTVAERRDSFCGKFSVCNNLHQAGIPFTVTKRHTVDPESESFRTDIRQFVGVCRVVKGLRRARFGMLGARTTAFNTVRFSEKILENSGITVETLDLSDVFGRIASLSDADTRIASKLGAVKAYAATGKAPDYALLKIAKLGVVLDDWLASSELDGMAIQCWTSIEENFGVFPCTVMSMLSNELIPAACETDIAGTLSMYALALASGCPSALVDWNNNYEDQSDKGIIFHCSNLPRSVFVDEIATVESHQGIASSFGQENSWGILYGRMKVSPFTYLRISTDDCKGKITAYVGEGNLTNDPVDTFGGYGVVQVPAFQDLLRYVCKNGFEHHVAITMSLVADSLNEALTTYLGWNIYYHKASDLYPMN